MCPGGFRVPSRPVALDHTALYVETPDAARLAGLVGPVFAQQCEEIRRPAAELRFVSLGGWTLVLGAEALDGRAILAEGLSRELSCRAAAVELVGAAFRYQLAPFQGGQRLRAAGFGAPALAAGAPMPLYPDAELEAYRRLVELGVPPALALLRTCEPISGPSQGDEPRQGLALALPVLALPPDARRDAEAYPLLVRRRRGGEADGPGSATWRREGIGSQVHGPGQGEPLPCLAVRWDGKERHDEPSELRPCAHPEGEPPVLLQAPPEGEPLEPRVVSGKANVPALRQLLELERVYQARAGVPVRFMYRHAPENVDFFVARELAKLTEGEQPSLLSRLFKR